MDRTDQEIRERSAAFFSKGVASSINVRDRDRNIPALLSRMIEAPGFSLLDIGCGRGLVAALAKDAYPDSDIHGVDLSEAAIKNARDLRPDISFSISDELLRRFESNQFDFATCRMSLHHYPRIQDHFEAVRRVLKPRGRYLIMDILPTQAHASALNDVFLKAESLCPGDGHVHFYTKDEFAAVFADTGFALLHQEVSYFDCHWSRNFEYMSVVADLILAQSQGFREWLKFEDEGDKYHYVMPIGNLIIEATK